MVRNWFSISKWHKKGGNRGSTWYQHLSAIIIGWFQCCCLRNDWGITSIKEVGCNCYWVIISGIAIWLLIGQRVELVTGEISICNISTIEVLESNDARASWCVNKPWLRRSAEEIGIWHPSSLISFCKREHFKIITARSKVLQTESTICVSE